MREKFAGVVFERSLLISLFLVGSSASYLFGAEPENFERLNLNLPLQPYQYSRNDFPDHVQKHVERLDEEIGEGDISNHVATLGRVLFYDRRLSVNGSISCGSCHIQKHGFSDPNRVSVGFSGQRGTRNSMALANLRFNPSSRFFWDERSGNLEAQVTMPIVDPTEMGHSLDAITAEFDDDAMYLSLFRQAFGDSRITKSRIARALAHFLRSMVSFNSKYDRGLAMTGDARVDFPNFDEQENLGKIQFFGRGRCAECHLPNLSQLGLEEDQFAFFQLLRPTVNGIDHDDHDNDPGVGGFTDQGSDRGRFKASSLRNIEVTSPYMHDGRFHTIDQVIEHYNWSVRPHANLDPRLSDFAANGMALPEIEKVALAAFLRTLTDHSFLTDPKFSDPFLVDQKSNQGE